MDCPGIRGASMIEPIQPQGVNETLKAIFDWIEFTIHHHTTKHIINDILELNDKDFMDIRKGKHGYEKQKLWNQGGIFILYNVEEEDSSQGIHIIITGNGCRQYEEKKNLRDLIVRITEVQKYKFTRIDIAIDDIKGDTINFEKFEKESNAGNISSLWYKFSVINEKRIADGEGIGRTIYYGSKKSAIFMRVYDKHLEQKKKQKNKEEIPELIKDNVNWTRMEIVFRDKRAELAAAFILGSDDIGKLIRGVLKQYIRFLKRPKQITNNKKRVWETARWWEKLIGDVDKIKLTIKPAEKTIEDMKKWIEKQISPTIAAITTANEGDMGWLIDLIVKGGTRLKTKHVQAITQHLQNQ